MKIKYPEIKCSLCQKIVPMTTMRRTRFRSGKTVFYCSIECRNTAFNHLYKSRLHLSRDELYRLYCIDDLSIIKIASMYQVSCTTVYNHLVQYAIPRKKRGWSQQGSNNSRYGKIDHLKFHRTFNSELGHYIRSSWEAIFAYWLKNKKFHYIYEPSVLPLTVSYRPDFYILELHRFVEVKGRWYKDAREKFDKFLKLYPNTILIEKRHIKLIQKQANVSFNSLLRL